MTGARGSDPADLSAAELLALFARRALSPVEAAEAAFRRIEAADPGIHAMVALDRPGALAAARAAEAAWRTGADVPPLCGLPVTVKDTIEVEGMPTTYGSLAFRDRRAPDAEIARRLRAAGAVILGKTNTSEFALSTFCANRLFPPTLNPADPARTAGGSSGGSAASVAAGMAPLSVGADSAGSIRIPAAFCGVFGLKPTFGTLPFWQEWRASPTRSHIGLFSRHVEDTRLAMAALAGGPGFAAPPVPAAGDADFLHGAALGHLPGDPDDNGVLGAVLDLLRAAGARPFETRPMPDFVVPGQLRDGGWPFGGDHYGAAERLCPGFWDRHAQDLTDYARPLYDAGRRALAWQYREVLDAAEIYKRRVQDWFAGQDFLIASACPEAPLQPADPADCGLGPRYPGISIWNLAGNPAATVPFGRGQGQADVDAAVAAARRALTAGPWPRLTGSERARLLWRVADLIMEHVEELAQLETLDQGKPIQVSRGGDVPASAETFRYMAGWATKLTGDTIPVGAPGSFRAYTVREPVGVVGQIVPWNFPLAMAAWKIAPALAAGCTLILKPAENTPLSTVRLFELMQQAGLPPGVVNLLTGFGHEAGAQMVAHPGIDKIAFTGSTAVGKAIVAGAAGNLKRVSLELGGKNPVIVLPDADLDRAIPGIVGAAFGNSGQVCTAPSRALVHRSVLAEVSDRLATQAEALRLGPGLAEDTQIGPVVSQRQMDSILDHIRGAVAEGARPLTGGGRRGNAGYFVPPTVLADTTPAMAINREEVFGPVIALMPFDDAEEAIRVANDSRYGLTAQVWTRDIATANRFADGLEFGSIWLNGKSMDIALPFGGLKESGWGLEKGAEGVELYTRTRTVVYAL